MASMPDEQKDALLDWRSTGRQLWRRVPVGWDDEDTSLAVRVARDWQGKPFVTVTPERRIRRGPGSGKWTHTGARGDMHERQQYLDFLGAVIRAGFHAEFIDVPDVERLFTEYRLELERG